MSEFQEINETVDVPLNTGVEGFIHALRQILKKPRVTDIHIDANGKVSFTRFARPEEPIKHLEVDFESVSPAGLVRNMELQELDYYELVGNAAVCIAAMFSMASTEQMYPVAFLVGASSSLFAWHRKTTGVPLLNSMAYGFPIIRDRHIPDDVLILVTAYARGGAMSDGKKSYKITMPSLEKPLQEVTPVEIYPQEQPMSSDVLVLVPPPEEVKVIE